VTKSSSPAAVVTGWSTIRAISGRSRPARVQPGGQQQDPAGQRGGDPRRQHQPQQLLTASSTRAQNQGTGCGDSSAP
jgi:hypothetical protein